jgi:hypothetical protein
MALRRLRGAVLRLVRRRGPTIIVGLTLALPAGWIEVRGRAVIYDAWWVDGLALVAGATGLALFWTGLTGGSPDWIDDGF